MYIVAAGFIDTDAPMSLGAVAAVVGVIMTWVLGGITIRRFIVEERKRKRDDEAQLEGLILRVCQTFTDSEGFQSRRDRAMTAIAQAVSDTAFRERARSFVDAGIDKERRSQIERRFLQMEATMAAQREDIIAIRANLAEAAGQVVKQVVREVHARMHENDGLD